MTDYQEQAAATRQQFDSAVSRIRASTTLTKDGKLAALAKAHAAGKQALAQLQQDADAHAVSDRQTLTRKAFAVDASGPHSAVSARDAYLRAGAVSDPSEAAALLAQADSSGDDVLARAVAQRAHDNGWSDVVDNYASSRPTAADALGKLAEIPTPTIRSKFIDAGVYYLAQPTELSSLPPGLVARLASDGPEAA